MSTTTLLLKIQDYINGIISLEEVEEWIAPRLPAVYKNNSFIAKKMVDWIQLGLIEIDAKRMTEEKLKAILTDTLISCSLERKTTWDSETISKNRYCIDPPQVIDTESILDLTGDQDDENSILIMN